MALSPRFKERSEVIPHDSVNSVSVPKEPKNVLRNEIWFLGTPFDRASLFAGTTKEVKHALDYAHGNRCRGFEYRDITGSPGQRGTRLSSSLR
jgi:hypothetical protein